MHYCERQHGIANAALSEHIIERLDLAIQSCTTIAHELANPSVSLTQEEQSTLDEFKASLDELLSCLRLLLEEWKDYNSLYASAHFGSSYQVPVLHTGRSRRGRLRFEIEKEQLEYLLSISFNWSEIAALLGVSRMTLYR